MMCPPYSRRRALFLGAVLATAFPAFARVAVEPIFGSDMVLQRDKPAPVWGTADASEEVIVRFGGQEKKTQADADGRWRVLLDPMKANAEPGTLEIAGKSNTQKLANVLVGEVWLCVGQSNMAFPLSRVRDAEKEIAAAENPNLRFFSAHFSAEPKPVAHVSGGWLPSTAKNAPRFSAVAYLFGRDLQQALKVPVGLVESSVSGSMAEIWMSREALLGESCLKPYLAAWDWLDAHYQSAGGMGRDATYKNAEGGVLTRDQLEKKFLEWRKAALEARKNGQSLRADFPEEFLASGSHVPFPDSIDRPACGFNSTIAPIAPFALRGVVWYQGESNVMLRYPENFFVTIKALIGEWRGRWENPGMPFLMVQLPNYGKPETDPAGGTWPILREQQAKLEKEVPSVFLATTIDTAVFDKGDLHPTNKQPVGQRLADVALARVYDQKVVSAGPAFQGLRVENGKARLTFAHTDGGLVAGPVEQAKPAAAPESPVVGFAIAGKDQTWHWAQARIEGNDVVVWSDAVAEPVAVRYAWADNPVCNLFNGAGWPASPFRTDVPPDGR